MPSRKRLASGASNKIIRANVKTLVGEGYNRDKAVAVALRKAGRGKKAK